MTTSFTGIIRKSVNNVTNQWDKLGNIANNLANYNTTGYKGISFEQMLNEDGYLSGAIRTNYQTGSTRITSNPFDVALTDVGFIPVVSPEGQVAYTRDGAFKQGKGGYLTTADDWIVGEGIKIPANCYKFEIKANGDVVAFDSAMSPEKKLGNIPLVRFDNPEGLEPTGMNKLVPTEDAGEAKLVKNPDCFLQNNLESANVNMYSSVNDMLRMNASMLASMQVLKVVNDMYNKAINIRE